MSSEERDIILQMVSEGKLSTAEASDLLDALNETEAESGEKTPFDPDWAESVAAEVSEKFGARWQEREMRRRERDMRRMERDMERMARQQERDLRRGGRGEGRSLLIHVTDGEETRVHVRIPIGMALSAGKFIPKKARMYFEEYGIDLSDMLDSVTNDLGRTGELINIQDGSTRVLVSIIGGDSVPIPPRPPIPPAPPVPPAPNVTPPPSSPEPPSASDVA